MSSSIRTQNIVKNIVVYTVLAIYLILLLFPFLWMFITSIKPDGDLYNLSRSPLSISKPTLEHYAYLFTNTSFLLWMKNSLVVAIASTAIAMVVSIAAAYSLSRLRWRGAEPMGLAIFITYLIPTALIFLPMAYVIRNLGLFDTQISLILVYPTFLIPFCTWLLMSYFRSIPRELEDCAMIDGASRFQAMTRIIIPLALPGIISAGLFAFTLSWNEFIYALTLAQTESIKTLPVGIVSQLVLGDVYFWGSLMAAALLGSVPVAILYAFFLEYYVKGMTAGAVKG